MFAHLYWLFPILLAIWLYAVTGDPRSAGLVIYASSGWSFIRSAFWLVRRDPNRARRWACFFLYLATAGWRAAAAAFVAVMSFGAFEKLANIKADLDHFVGVMLILIAGVGVATFLGIIGSTVALTGGARVFVVGNLVGVSKGRFPPIGFTPSFHRQFNQLVFVLALTVFAPIELLFCGMCILDVAMKTSWMTQVGLAGMMLGPLPAFWIYANLSHRIVAANPFECWPESIVTQFRAEFNNDESEDSFFDDDVEDESRF